MFILRVNREIDYMRDAEEIVSDTLVEVKTSVKPGVSKRKLDKIAEKYIRSCGTIPAFEDYNLYSLKKLKNGDNVNDDIKQVIFRKDNKIARTFPIGEVNAKLYENLDVIIFSLSKGIEKAMAVSCLGDISNAVQTFAKNYSYGIVRDYVGHGIGEKMHEDPQIPNYGSASRGPRFQSGKTLAIEPMINLGTHKSRH